MSNPVDAARGLLVFAVVAILAGTSLVAHHGSAVSYDIDKQVTLTGTVTEVVWRNPHIFIMFDVKDDKGNVVNWGAESHPPAGMARNRVNDVLLPFTSTTVKAGDVVTIVVFPSRINAPRGLLAKVVKDGKVLLDDGETRNRGGRQ